MPNPPRLQFKSFATKFTFPADDHAAYKARVEALDARTPKSIRKALIDGCPPSWSGPHGIRS